MDLVFYTDHQPGNLYLIVVDILSLPIERPLPGSPYKRH